MKLKDLSNKFKPEDIEWRLQQCGVKNDKVWAMCLAYITNRAIMERLDEVCGPENWKNEYAAGPHGGVVCGLSIKVNGEWVTKWDGAENTDIEAVKGGLSGAMKRAAVQWGIGRYLYQLEEGFANIADNGAYRGKTKEGKHFKWNPPTLPQWALPTGSGSQKQEGASSSTPPPAPSQGANYAFLKAMGEQKVRVGEDLYYKTLGVLGFEKSSEIKDREVQKEVYKMIIALPDKMEVA